MSNIIEKFTVGVEEEYQIVNTKTRELHSRQERILNGAQDALGKHVTPELYLSQMQNWQKWVISLRKQKIQFDKLMLEATYSGEKVLDRYSRF